MKKQQFNITLPDDLKADLARLAASRGLSTAGLVRQLVADELSSITGKTYSEIQHGGARQRPRKSQAKPSPRRRESGSGVSNIPNPEGRGVSDLRKLPSVPESVRRPSKHKKTQSNEN